MLAFMSEWVAISMTAIQRSIYERGSKDRGLASYICSLHYASSGPIHIHKYNPVQHDIIYIYTVGVTQHYAMV